MHLHERWPGDDAAYNGRLVYGESSDLMLNVIVINRWPEHRSIVILPLRQQFNITAANFVK
jgi:hypothetical protein